MTPIIYFNRPALTINLLDDETAKYCIQPNMTVMTSTSERVMYPREIDHRLRLNIRQCLISTINSMLLTNINFQTKVKIVHIFMTKLNVQFDLGQLDHSVILHWMLPIIKHLLVENGWSWTESDDALHILPSNNINSAKTQPIKKELHDPRVQSTKYHR